MIDALHFFYRWKLFRMECASGNPNPRFRKKPMGESGFGQMALVWTKWTAFCAARNIAWVEAREADVEGYLQSIGSRRRARIVGDKGKTVLAPGWVKTDSRVTIRRYWRILDELYAFGLEERYVQHNPARKVKPEDGESSLSEVLSDAEYCRVFERLPSGESQKSCRDRLLLLLIARYALTVSEILSLKTTDVSLAPGAHFEPAAFADDRRDTKEKNRLICELNLGGRRQVQSRTIVLDEMTSWAMQKWLLVRPQKSSGNRLFVNLHGGMGLTAGFLRIICSSHLELCGINLDRQTGPNTFRNTCIVNWLNGRVPIHEVMRRCGLQAPAFLQRFLPHVSPYVAELYAQKKSFERVPIVIEPVEHNASGGKMPVLFKVITPKHATGNGDLNGRFSEVWDGTPMHAKSLVDQLRRSHLDISRGPTQ